jgi:branched-subunit amino acid ABC-type transport system permease component
MLQVIVGQILNGIILGSLYGIIALGVTMTFGITGIVNFALGQFMMIGAYATWYFTDLAMLPFPVAVVLAVVFAAAAGLIADQALFRFTRNNLVNGLLVSIGLISVMESGALLLFTTTPKNMDVVISGSWSLGAITLPRMKVVAFLLLVAVIGLTWLGLSRAWLGRATRAYAQNPEAAMLMGVPTKLLQTGVVVYSCALAGFGGALYASLFSLEPSLGGLFILKGVEAAILAGVGNLLGALVGGAILGVTESVGSLYLPSAFRDAYGLVFLVAILLFRPAGLFGSQKCLVPLYLLPLLVKSDVVLTILIFTFVLSILAVGFNIVFGGAGQLTMFHAAAFGIGSYVTFLSMLRFGISFWLGFLVAVAIVILISIVIGWICFKFRLKEFYFAVVTLAFAELCRLVALNWTSVTNGTLGMLVLEKPTVWLPGSGVVKIEQTGPWYFLTLVSLTGVLIFAVLLMRSWIGRNFSAIRLNEDLAQTLGIDTFRYKLLAFTISNVIAALAGALYGFYTGYIEPAYLAVTQSLDAIAMVLLGGVSTILGPVVGALVLTSLPHLIELPAEMRVAVYGMILILVILLMPRGIVGLFAGLLKGRVNAA